MVNLRAEGESFWGAGDLGVGLPRGEDPPLLGDWARSLLLKSSWPGGYAAANKVAMLSMTTSAVRSGGNDGRGCRNRARRCARVGHCRRWSCERYDKGSPSGWAAAEIIETRRAVGSGWVVSIQTTGSPDMRALAAICILTRAGQKHYIRLCERAGGLTRLQFCRSQGGRGARILWRGEGRRGECGRGHGSWWGCGTAAAGRRRWLGRRRWRGGGLVGC